MKSPRDQEFLPRGNNIEVALSNIHLKMVGQCEENKSKQKRRSLLNIFGGQNGIILITVSDHSDPHLP